MKKNDGDREWKQRAISKAENTFNVVKSINTLHTAISNIDIKSITQILDIAEGAGLTTLSELILSHSESGETTLNAAIKVGSDAIVLKLLRGARGIEDNKDTLTKLLLSTNRFGETALHCAAEMQFINNAIPKKLLNFARRAGGNTLTKLLLSRDNSNETALHKAVEVGNDPILLELLRGARGIEDNKDTLTKLLLSTNRFGETALHYAAISRNSGILTTLLLAAKNVTDSNIVLTKLLLSIDMFEETALDNAINGGSTNIAKTLLLTTAYVGKLSVGSNESSSNIILAHSFESNDINNFIDCLQDDRNIKYIEKHTLKELLTRKETIAGLFCIETDDDPLRSKRSTHKELENVIDRDSSDNPANKENENVDNKSGGWLKWLSDSLQLPTILKGTEANVIENEIARLEEERDDFNQTNNLPSISNVDRHIESMSIGYNTNATVANSSSIPPIGDGINNISVQEMVPSITASVVLFRAVLNKLGLNVPLNISLGNNYTSPQQEHEIKVKELTLDILHPLQMNKDLFGDDVSEEELPDLLYSNNSSINLHGDI